MKFLSPLGRVWILFTLLIAWQILPSRAQQPPDQQPAPAQAPPPGQQAAQQPPAPQQPAPIVRQIEIQYAGPATLSRQRILSNMRTTVGQPYSESTVEEDVRSLYATGLVTNVRIYGQPV